MDIDFGAGFGYEMVGFRGNSPVAQINKVSLAHPEVLEVIREPASMIPMAVGLVATSGMPRRRRRS